MFCGVLFVSVQLKTRMAENAELTISTVSFWTIKIPLGYKPFFVEAENGKLPNPLFCFVGPV